MTWVLCYDVVEDRRRSRFHKRLKGFMVPVQRSVFEGPLPPAALRAVERLIVEVLDMQTDSIRLYAMTPACSGMSKTFGTAARLPDPELPLVL